MKALKILLSLIAIILLLIIATVIALPQLVDPNDYKQEITKTVKSHTGLDLVIQGDLSLSVFPWLGVKTGQISLAQPEEITSSGDFVRLDEANIKVKLKPLLERKLEVDTVLLKSPKINIIVNKNGLSSIDAIASKFQGEQNASSTTSNTKNQNNEAAAIAALTIAGINISDGTVIYDDRKIGAKYEVKELNITSGNLLSGETAPLSLAGEVSGNTLEPMTLKLDSLIALNTKTLNAVLTDVVFSSNFGNIPLSTTVPIATIDANKTMAVIPKFSIESLGLQLSGDLRISNWDKVPTAVGHLNSNTFNAQALLQKLGVTYTPSQASALTKVQSSFSVTASPKGASLQEIKLQVDDSLLAGHAAIINMENPQYRFDLSLDKIVIDPYLPKSDDTGNSNTKTPDNAAAGLLAPLAIFNKVLAKGDFRAKSIQANNLKISDVNVNVDSNKSSTTIKPKLSLYEGSLNGVINLTKSKNPILKINSSLNDIALEPLLIDAAVTDQLSGIGNLDADITITEKEGKPLKQGTIKLIAKDGAIKGIDIKKIIEEAKRIARQQSGNDSTTSNTDEKTHFADMTATLVINNHIINNDDLIMKAPALRVEGEGSIDTLKQTADYLTSIYIVETSKGQGGKNREDLGGIAIPVRTTGPLKKLDTAIDGELLLKRLSEKFLDKEKDKLKEKLLEKLGISSTKNIQTESAPSQATQQESQAEPEQSLEDKLKEDLKKKLFKKLF